MVIVKYSIELSLYQMLHYVHQLVTVFYLFSTAAKLCVKAQIMETKFFKTVMLHILSERVWQLAAS